MLHNVPSLDVTRAKVSFVTVLQAIATAESKKSIVRENENHDAKVWGICWKGQKELCIGKTWGGVEAGGTYGKKKKCRARNLTVPVNTAILLSGVVLTLPDKLTYFCLLPGFFPAF